MPLADSGTPLRHVRSDLGEGLDVRRLVRSLARRRDPFVLESSDASHETGRRSYFGCEPDVVLTSRSDRFTTETHVEGGESRTRHEAGVDPFAEVARALGSPVETPDGSGEDDGFCGGWVGYLGYGLRRKLENLPDRHGPASVPDLRLARYRHVIELDHRTGRASVRAWLREGEDPGSARARVERLLDEAAGREGRAFADPRVGRVLGDFDRRAYEAAVERARDYVLAGDVFQVNLAQRFRASFDGHPAALYEAHRTASPAPFAGYLGWGDGALVSASPERFLEVRGRRVETRPIKGTRPRGTSREEDAALAAELWASSKDAAELAMIVDLERNDLGRVCEYGSVEVACPRRLETFRTVHHTSARITGRLREAAGPVDLLRATFPGGSITGAPKIRAMEIIDELERAPRGPYTGALGYIGFDGAMDWNILIRSVVVAGRELSYHVGGGIVADSSPAQEWEETLHKARGTVAILSGQRHASEIAGGDVDVRLPS